MNERMTDLGGSTARGVSAGGATVTRWTCRSRRPSIWPRGQADLNEFVAYMIMGQAFNEMRYLDRAVTALLNFNLAAGFELCEEAPPDDVGARQLCARTAVNAVRDLDRMSRWDATRARPGG